MKRAEGTDKTLIDVKEILSRTAFPGASFLSAAVGRGLSIPPLNGAYARFVTRLADERPSPERIFDTALEVMAAGSDTPPDDLKRIPDAGPLVVVANHPFGGVEGVILAALLLKVRKDVRVLGNYLLKRIAGVRDHVIAVDPFGGRGPSAKANLKGIKEALHWVKSGGALLTFPAGEVASFRVRDRRVTDPAWSPHVAGIVRRSRAATLPVYLPGRNSLLFQVLGMIHPRVRTALLPREFVNKFGRRFDVVIGQPVDWSKLARLATDADRIDYLRFATYLMQNRHSASKKHRDPPKSIVPGPVRKPVVGPADCRKLAKEVAALPEKSLLVAHGDLAVHFAGAGQIPCLLREIGRLREITFREVGEGTGGEIDLDRFDRTYQHLFLWNRAKKELVGAYRLGLTDRILSETGVEGLYTNLLFRFKPEFVDRLGTAIEFGRSFIRSEYQRQFSSLMLLWKGIGAFIALHPRYHLLFGAVSISSDYQGVSKNLMIRFLKAKQSDAALSRLVSPRRPYKVRRIVGVRNHILDESFQDLDDVSLLVSAVEKDGKGIPVLLRQYLKLAGRLLCFNVDRTFSDVVDGLLMVDLRYTEPRLMKRFIGEEGCKRFYALHGPARGPQRSDEMPAKRHETAA